jgi:hypothetical protein
MSFRSRGRRTSVTAKHIHFNDVVEQYIAIDVLDDEGLSMSDTSKRCGRLIAKLPPTTLKRAKADRLLESELRFYRALDRLCKCEFNFPSFVIVD